MDGSDLSKSTRRLHLLFRKSEYTIILKFQTLNLKGQNLPPSVVMSQYALNGCPVSFGSIQYSPFFCALVYFQMSLQETPGKSGDEPFLTDRREEM